MPWPIYINPGTRRQMSAVLADINDIFRTLLDANIELAEANEAVSAFEVVYTPSDGIVGLAQADSITKGQPIGFAKQGAASGVDLEYQSSGIIENVLWSLTVGSLYFLSGATAGAIVTTPDTTTTGALAIIVGRALTPTKLLIFFGSTIKY